MKKKNTSKAEKKEMNETTLKKCKALGKIIHYFYGKHSESILRKRIRTGISRRER